jgi:hypothetical protein
MESGVPYWQVPAWRRKRKKQEISFWAVTADTAFDPTTR